MKILKKYRYVFLDVLDIIIIILAYFATYIFKNEVLLNISEEALKTTTVSIIFCIILYRILLKQL